MKVRQNAKPRDDDPTLPSRGASPGCWRSLRETPTDSGPWLALVRHYAQRNLDWQAAYAARQAARLDAAAAKAIEAIGIGNWRDESAGDARLGRADLPDAEALAARFWRAVEDDADDWLSWLYLARLGEFPGVGPSADALARACELEFITGESLHRLGVWRLHAGDGAGAAEALGRLVDIRPMRHGSMMYLGEALIRIGQVAAAEQAFARASLSSHPDFLIGLAGRVYAHNYWQEAIAVLRKAIDLRPQHVGARLQLARIQSEVYALADCRASLRALRTLDPANTEAALLEAGLLGRTGDARAHLAALQAAYESGGDPLSRLASSIAMTALYHDEMPATETAALHQRLCAPIAAALRETTSFANSRRTDRRLRVGYVSGDFHRQHPVNLFMLPVLQRHDHERFEIFVYHTGTMHDEYTRQARACADRWLDAAALDDPGLHQAIVADGIDLLVDLAGHTSTHRLGVFAMRAAPVQATFLGYPHSTGLATIDWLIGDAVVSPAGHARLFSEGIAQLPGSVFCWAPVDAYPLPPARPDDAPLVFGSFNNAMKLSPRTVALWARILQAVPDSLLLLKAPSLGDAAVQARFSGLFADHGITAGRLRFRGPSELGAMMQEYGDVDIALDPVPYNGGTTTLQALWMGVPVISLVGDNFVGRMGASFLETLGRHEWIATDDDGYIARAQQLAGQPGKLRRGRPALRRQMAGSALCDLPTYVGRLEALFVRMWEVWCTGSAARLLHAAGCEHSGRPAAAAGERREGERGTPAQAPGTPRLSASPAEGNRAGAGVSGDAGDPLAAPNAATTSPPDQSPESESTPMASPASPTHSPAFEITTSRQFLSWLDEQKLSIALTTYQIGKLFFLGLRPDGELSIFERSFNRCMGLCTTTNGLYMSSLYQVWRFENLFTRGETQDHYDRLYLPQVAYTTGDLDIHDMAVDADGRLVFVNTLFGCLATLSETHSFKPLWKPSFISRLAAEDRCHLNGLAMKDGRPAYVTAVSRSDVVDGWRDHRADGGVVIDVESTEVVAGGLSMPHSPRWHQGKLWLLNSGTGEFGHVELATGRFVPLAFCAGYMRGLAFHGDFALVGLSKPRHNRTFSGLPLDDALRSKQAEPRCGIQVIDLRTGDAVHWLRIEGVVDELYDVVTLPGVRRPMALGVMTDEIRRVLSVEE